VSLGPESEFECECPLTEVLPPSLDDVVLCQGLDGVADDITIIIYLSLLSLTGDTIDATMRRERFAVVLYCERDGKRM